MEHITKEKLGNLLIGTDARFYCVYDWDLTEDEENSFKTAEIGDEITIESQMVPVVIDEGKGFFIGAYTSEEEIPEEFRKEKAIQRQRIEEFIIACKASNTVLKEDVALVRNPFSSEEGKIVFSMKEVDDIYFEIIRRVKKKYG